MREIILSRKKLYIKTNGNSAPPTLRIFVCTPSCFVNLVVKRVETHTRTRVMSSIQDLKKETVPRNKIKKATVDFTTLRKGITSSAVIP